VRLREITLILLCVAILGWAGLGPLFGSQKRYDTIRQECQMFYGPGGPEAVAYCIAEMAQRSAAAAR
jgi:hypothetical protein